MNKARHLLTRPLFLILCLLGVTLLACGPFLTGGLWHGSDPWLPPAPDRKYSDGAGGRAVPGAHPVRLGERLRYAVGVFYGDVLLYAPALLRLAGVPVSAAYDAYLFGHYAVHGGGRLLCGPPAWRRALRVRGRGGAVHPFGIPPVRCHRPCGPWGVHGPCIPAACPRPGFWRTLRPDRARLPGWALLVPWAVGGAAKPPAEL